MEPSPDRPWVDLWIDPRTGIWIDLRIGVGLSGADRSIFKELGDQLGM